MSWFDNILGAANNYVDKTNATKQANAAANAAVANTSLANQAAASAKAEAFPPWARNALIGFGGLLGIILVFKAVKGK